MKKSIANIGIALFCLNAIAPNQLPARASITDNILGFYCNSNQFIRLQDNISSILTNETVNSENQQLNYKGIAQNKSRNKGSLVPPKLPSCISKQKIDSYVRSQGFPQANYPYFGTPDGCGSSAGGSWKYRPVPDGPINENIYFTKACNRHDICYMSNSSKSNCDRQMYDATKQICANANYRNPLWGFSKFMCDIGAGSFDLLVDSRLTQKAYKNAQDNQQKYVNLVQEYIDKNGQCSNCRYSERQNRMICDNKKPTTPGKVEVYGPIKTAPDPLREILEQIERGNF